MMDTAALEAVITAGRRFAITDADLTQRLRKAAEEIVGRTAIPSEWPERLYEEAHSLEMDLRDLTNHENTEKRRKLASRFYDLIIEVSSEIQRHYGHAAQERREHPTDN